MARRDWQRLARALGMPEATERHAIVAAVLGALDLLKSEKSAALRMADAALDRVPPVTPATTEVASVPRAGLVGQYDRVTLDAVRAAVEVLARMVDGGRVCGWTLNDCVAVLSGHPPNEGAPDALRGHVPGGPALVVFSDQPTPADLTWLDQEAGRG